MSIYVVLATGKPDLVHQSAHIQIPRSDLYSNPIHYHLQLVLVYNVVIALIETSIKNGMVEYLVPRYTVSLFKSQATLQEITRISRKILTIECQCLCLYVFEQLGLSGCSPWCAAV